MMKSILKTLLFSVPLLVFSEQILAFRCGNKIIVTGDRMPKILRRCGEPDYEETREYSFPSNCEYGYYSDDYNYNDGYNFTYRRQRRTPSYRRCRTEIVDVWTYNFGPRKLMRELIFRNGILKKINTLEYGY